MKKTENTKLTVKSSSQKVQKLSCESIIMIVGLIVLTIGILAIAITVFFNVTISFASEKSQFKRDNLLLNISLSFFALGIFYIVYKILPKINKKILIIITLILGFVLGMWWVNYIEFKPISDQSLMVYCGEKFYENDLPTILNPGEYLNRNPHQLGFCIYIMTLFKIISKSSVILLQNLNVIYFTISAFTLYLICKEIFEEDIVQKICLLLISFFSIYWSLFSVHVYGNIPGLMFSLISVLFTLKYLKNGKIYNFFIISISIAIAYLLKSNYQIFSIAIIIVLVLHFLQTYKKESLIGILIVLSVMFSFKTFVYKHVENGTGYSLSEGVPMIAYVYMGIAEPKTLTPGWYTADVIDIYDQSQYNKEKAAEYAKTLLKERIKYLISNPLYTCDYFTNKLQTTWLNPTFQVFWCSTPSTLLDIDTEYNFKIMSKPLINDIICGDIYKFLERVMDIFEIITYSLAGIALLSLFRKGNLKDTLMALIFLGGFIFHLIWETKAIYVIQYFYIILPFSAYGIYLICQFVDKKIKEILSR